MFNADGEKVLRWWSGVIDRAVEVAKYDDYTLDRVCSWCKSKMGTVRMRMERRFYMTVFLTTHRPPINHGVCVACREPLEGHRAQGSV